MEFDVFGLEDGHSLVEIGSDKGALPYIGVADEGEGDGGCFFVMHISCLYEKFILIIDQQIDPFAYHLTDNS